MGAEVFVHAIYADRHAAAKAVEALVDAAFPSNRVAALVHKDERLQELRVRHKTGVGIGSVMGALLGLIAGAVLFMGPWRTALEGGVAGAAIGALLGTLAGLGYWKEDIDFPSTAFGDGGACVGVTTNEGRVQSARAALLQAGAREAHVSSKRDAFRTGNMGALHFTTPHRSA